MGYGHTCTKVGNYLVIFGGVADHKITNDMYIIDTQQRKLMKIPVDNIIVPRYYHSAILIQNNICFVGGRCGSSESSYVEYINVFNVISKKWTFHNNAFKNDVLLRENSSLCLLGSSLFVFGGERLADRYNSVKSPALMKRSS